MSMKKLYVSGFLSALLIALQLTGSFGPIQEAGAHFEQDQTGSDRYMKYYSSNPDASIGARSIAGNWASFSDVEGTTKKQQIDSKLLYLEQQYQKTKEIFIVVEGVSLDEVYDMDDIRYMYENSSLYRQLVSVQDVLYIAPEASFSQLADEGKDALYERYAFYLENSKELELSVSYSLDQGRMGFFILSSQGDIIYQQEPCTTFKKSIPLSLKEGLYSLVLTCELDDQGIGGMRYIQGKIK